ncbi:hypothetical protein SPRG_06681 [Saprolegnia parasitica CBS 223.65]|uniref:Uncharacterized protein n=1 Tax=Saprolegnia parasitica (strain CBS 223.65) TaxID=695850 RepID=A0A067CD59_SAPPC|nr:hypothetical protein SPRG_06681 [Saprolegnia parasitica CBS 223.65]KDO28443.1 hypothetical protein SPRG_06681 [Saprolegnia parasitica CBS 223.65]|eukprot:XP_012200883.1 hypothetical protein SPRG_06681 [Saprolegnia parasitica CBS 223.65]
MRSLYLVLVAAFVAATHSACPDGQWEVSLLNSGTVYCVGGEPCSGRYTPGQSFGKYFCPQEGQPNVDGTTTLQMQTCCGVMNGNIMGCQPKTDNVQCVGPLPAPYKTPAPTTSADTTTSPVTTTPTETTLSPDATTLSPNATTLSPNATTLSPNATTLSPNATTLSPDVTTTDSSSSGLETKWIVLIAIGAVVLLALIGGLFLFGKKRESPSYLESPAGEEMLTPGPGSAAGGALTPRHNVTLL